MCHVNSNDNTACAQHPPCACRCSIISPRLWQDPRFAGTRIPACLPQPQIMKTRLGCEIAHLHFLLIFPFQRKNERSWGREGEVGVGPSSSLPGLQPHSGSRRGKGSRVIVSVITSLSQRKIISQRCPEVRTWTLWRGEGR